MQGTGGKKFPPPRFVLIPLGQMVSGPELCGPGQSDLAQSGGLGRVRPRPSLFSLLGRHRPSTRWADIGPVTFGLGPVQFSWPAQPLLIYKYIIIILYYYYYYYYMCVYMLYIYKKNIYKKNIF